MQVQYLFKQYQGVGVRCRYVVPESVKAAGDGDLAQVKTHLFKALSGVILEHPLLQVGMIDTDQRVAKFVEIDSINLDKHVTWHTWSVEEYDQKVEESMVTEVDRPFDEAQAATTPGWRLVVSYPESGPDWFDANFIFKHTIADGMSGKLFHKTLLSHLNQTATGGANAQLKGNVLDLTTTGGKPRTYPPPIDKMVKFSVPGRWALGFFWDETKPEGMKTRAEHQVQATWAPFLEGGGDGGGPQVAAATGRRTLVVDGQTTTNLVQRCRAHGTTMTGLVHAILLVSGARQLPAARAPGFVTNTALDLRRFVPKSLDADNMFANIVSTRDFVVAPDVARQMRAAIESGREDEVEAQLWSVAKSVRQDLQERLETGLSKEPVGVMKFVRDWRGEFKNLAKRTRKLAFHVSNLGVLDGDPASDGKGDGERWKVVKGVFSMSRETAGSVVSVFMMTVKGRDMLLDLTWQQGSAGDDIVDGLREDLEAWLKKLGKGSEEV